MEATKIDYVSLHREQLEVAYNNRDLEAILGVYAPTPEFVDYPLGVTLRSVDEIREYVLERWKASSDEKVLATDIVGMGDWTVARFTSGGTQGGPFGTLAATNRPFTVNLCNVTRWRDGKIVEDHLYYDLYGLLAQLGQVPSLFSED